MDEAGTVPEWQAALLPGLTSLRHAVFIGDPAQLPPFTRVEGKHVPSSFLERVQEQMKRVGLEMPLLNIQFRMEKNVSSCFVDNLCAKPVLDNKKCRNRLPT